MDRKRSLCLYAAEQPESRGVYSHVSGTPQAGSRDQVTLWRLQHDILG